MLVLAVCPQCVRGNCARLAPLHLHPPCWPACHFVSCETSLLPLLLLDFKYRNLLCSAVVWTGNPQRSALLPPPWGSRKGSNNMDFGLISQLLLEPLVFVEPNKEMTLRITSILQKSPVYKSWLGLVCTAQNTSFGVKGRIWRWVVSPWFNYISSGLTQSFVKPRNSTFIIWKPLIFLFKPSITAIMKTTNK